LNEVIILREWEEKEREREKEMREYERRIMRIYIFEVV
jgi:hypothetical protein